MRFALPLLGLLILAPLGCDSFGAKKSSDETSADDDDEPKKKKKKKKKDRDEDEPEKPATSATSTGTVATPSLPLPPPPTTTPPLPPGRSAVPTLDEWNAVVREVTVKGSSALGCETKMVREWMRISCRGKNDTGGKPLSIVRQRGAHDAFLFAKGDVISAVLPYVEGTDATLAFAWTDKSHLLNLKWPRGAPKPPVLGVFEGARSPLDGGRADPTLCGKCQRELAYMQMGAGVCELISSNPYCLTTYGSDCQKLRECAFGEPSAQVSCPVGMVRIGTGHACAKPCGSGRSCPAGEACDDHMANVPVCLPN